MEITGALVGASLGGAVKAEAKKCLWLWDMGFGEKKADRTKVHWLPKGPFFFFFFCFQRNNMICPVLPEWKLEWERWKVQGKEGGGIQSQGRPWPWAESLERERRWGGGGVDTVEFADLEAKS